MVPSCSFRYTRPVPIRQSLMDWLRRLREGDEDRDTSVTQRQPLIASSTAQPPLYKTRRIILQWHPLGSRLILSTCRTSTGVIFGRHGRHSHSRPWHCSRWKLHDDDDDGQWRSKSHAHGSVRINWFWILTQQSTVPSAMAQMRQHQMAAMVQISMATTTATATNNNNSSSNSNSNNNK